MNYRSRKSSNLLGSARTVRWLQINGDKSQTKFLIDKNLSFLCITEFLNFSTHVHQIVLYRTRLATVRISAGQKLQSKLILHHIQSVWDYGEAFNVVSYAQHQRKAVVSNFWWKEMTIVKALNAALGSVRLHLHNSLSSSSLNLNEKVQLLPLRKNLERQIIDTCAESENTLSAAENKIIKFRETAGRFKRFQTFGDYWKSNGKSQAVLFSCCSSSSRKLSIYVGLLLLEHCSIFNV